METGSIVPDRPFFRIGDVAEIVGVKPYVLRYWETEFAMVSPDKTAAGHRVYRRKDVENLLLIKRLLYFERYSIEGARKRLKELRKEGLLTETRRNNVSSSTKPVERASPGIGLPGKDLDDEQALRERLRKIHELSQELKAMSKTAFADVF